MLKTIWDGLKGLAGSKKFQAAVLAGVIWTLGKLHLNLTTEQLAPIVAPLWLFIFGQGLADFGKSAAIAKAANDNAPAAAPQDASKAA